MKNSQRLKSAKVVFIIVLISITIAGTFAFVVSKNSKTNELTQSSPNFETLLPVNKTIATLGGWNRVSPPDKTPVYSYTDKVDSTLISVSQQSLPESFKKEPELQTSKLAESYNAITKFDASGTTVYLGNSAAGPQSIIFTKNNLLILIKSQNKINEKAWISYIQTLR